MTDGPYRGPYREPPRPVQRRLTRWERAKLWWCGRVGHRWFEIFHLERRPRICFRCGEVDQDGLTFEEMDAAVVRACRKLDQLARGGA